ncbi:MAG: chloride channel protein [Anaerotignum lactatifermentans]
MLERLNRYLEGSEKGVYVFLIWSFIGAVIGAVVGVVGIIFHILLEEVTAFRMSHPWILFLLPLGGLVIAGLYHLLRMQNDRGTNLILIAVRVNEKVSLRLTPLIFISTIITHLLGGSAGREGAALQIGGSIGSFIGRKIKLDEKDERIITMCGMSAGFAALFGTPVAAVVFSMEVITVGIMHYSAIVPSIIAAITATGISMTCGVTPTAFTLESVPALSPSGVGSVILLGMFCAGVSVLFCLAMETAGKYYKQIFKNGYIRIFVGGCIVVAITLLLGTRDYNGAGMDVIARAIAGEAEYPAFLWKILLTALTLGAGYKGGEIVPSFFVGATFGCVIGPWIGLPASFAAGTGMAALFCGVTNCPIASVILCVELFGAEGIAYYTLACAVSYMLSGYYGLYSEQKIMYSKMQPEFINKSVH